ncbi:hypothetical protein [Hydrogenobaculum acidophilum]
MVYFAIVLMGAIPYYLFFKSPKPKNTLMIFLISIIGFLMYSISPSIPKNMYYDMFAVVAFATSLLTFYLSYKTTNLMKLSYYFLFLNAVSVFILPYKVFNVYYSSVVIASALLYVIALKYIEIFESANFYNVKGLALTSPKLALMIRLTLMALGLYPPFSNSFSLLLGILKGDLSKIGYLIISWIFFANFFMAFRIMKNTIFGAPNENVIYKDISGKSALVMTIVLLMLTLLGLSSFLEALI